MANILIVDDSRTSRKILKEILEKNGQTVIAEAVNGEEGVALFKQCKPDLVTMDITMPAMDGLEALAKIMEVDSEAKVVMVTAAGQSNKMTKAVELGAMEFVVKPYEEDLVIGAIQNSLK